MQALENVLEPHFGPTIDLKVADCQTRSISRRKSQFDRGMDHYCCARWEDDTSKRWISWFSFRSWGTHFSSFITLTSCLKWWEIVEWSTFSSSEISLVVSFNYCPQLIIVNIRWTSRPTWSSRLVLPVRNFSNQRRAVFSEVVSSPHIRVQNLEAK